MEMSRPTGGTPMVKIDGAKVRSLREAQGLTQLFLATTVEVTTDTISRWENKRYPTIKKENGLKLAETLGVELEEILECEDEPQENETQIPAQEQQEEQIDPLPSLPDSAPDSKSRFGLYAVVVGVLGAFFLWWFSASQDQVHVSAHRLLPSQAVSGQSFPVAITLSTESSEPVSVILTETLPKGAELLAVVPPFSAYDKEQGELKWLRKINGNQIFAYRVTVHQQPGSTIDFSGTVARRTKTGQPISVKGNHGLSLADVHWADRDGDGIICDEEILTVYDVFSEIEGLGVDIDQVEEIWLGSGYVWNSESAQFDIKN